METTSMNKHLEKGQSMILMTFLLFAFFAILALVLDGGFLYYMRRNAQNAADAGALAGADDLCQFENMAQAENVARSFAFDNGVTTAVAKATWVDPGGYVEVNTTINYQSFFARLLNLNSFDPPAYAKAGCAPPEGVGVMPVAWSCKAPIGPGPQPQECNILFMDDERMDLEKDGQCKWGFDPMYIIADSDTIGDDIVCDDPEGPIGSGGVDCDLNGDTFNDVELLGGGDRSWLDLNGGGGGANELKAWIGGDYEDLNVRIHNWAPVQTGNVSSAYQEVHKKILGKDVVVPVFNAVHPDGPPPEDWPHSEDDVIGNEPHDYYHISSFSYWRSTCVDAGPYPQGSETCPAREALNVLLAGAGWSNGAINSLNTIEGCFIEGFSGGGIGGQPGQGIDAGVYTVFLME